MKLMETNLQYFKIHPRISCSGDETLKMRSKSPMMTAGDDHEAK